jgi:hypothetical protein
MRFTSQEELLIVEFCNEHKHILDGNSSRPDVQKKKKEKWEEFVNQLNALNPTAARRTVEEVKKKWQNMKLKSKEKNAANKREIMKTGGGSSKAMLLSAAEELILTNLGDTPQFSGICGGIETEDE